MLNLIEKIFRVLSEQTPRFVNTGGLHWWYAFYSIGTIVYSTTVTVLWLGARNKIKELEEKYKKLIDYMDRRKDERDKI